MADLTKLKEFGEEIRDVLKDLFPKSGRDEDSTNNRPARDAVAKLKALVARADRPTPASLAQRADAITSVRTALTDVLVEASSNPTSLSSARVRTIQAQRNALRNAFGLLLEREAFEPIAQLIPPAQINTISEQLTKADEAIRERQKAKKVLDVTVKVLITGARIAAKVA